MNCCLRSVAVTLLLAAGCNCAFSASPVRIALLTPLSGPMALQGESVSRQLHAAADDINAQGGLFGGAKIEIVDFDDQLSPQQGLIALQSAISRDIRFVTQGLGSSVGLALSDGIAKHNVRNPAKSVLFLNYGGLDPEMTNSKCHFWHFRFDAHTDMRVNALAEYLRKRPAMRKVYLINQDYAWGQSVGRAGEGNLKVLVPWVRDAADTRSARFADDFKDKTGDDWSFEPFRHMLRMLVAATNQAQSVEPLAVAKALEGMRIAGKPSGG